MKVTRVDRGRTVDARYLDAITRRFEQRDLSPSGAKWPRRSRPKPTSSCFARIAEFWVCNLTDRAGWAHYTPQQRVPAKALKGCLKIAGSDGFSRLQAAKAATTNTATLFSDAL
jgi:hypothetical protein